MLASLLKQLSKGQTSLPSSVKDLYDRCKTGLSSPTLDNISEALQSVLKLYSRVFIVIDALDECETDDRCRQKLLTEIFSPEAEYRVSLFATSRPNPEIRREFQESMSLEIRAKEEDVRRYLDGRIRELPEFVVKNSKLQEEIKTEIVQAVAGMFLLAKFHLDSLIDEDSPRSIRAALKTLPTGSDAYNRVYEDTMKRIEGQRVPKARRARRVLSWIICAMRPLSTSELQHGLAIQSGDTELHEDGIIEVEDMVSACAGLVTVDEESKIIRLVHKTTQEYLSRTQARWFPKAEIDNTVTCVTYLSMSIFEIGSCQTDEQFEERLRSNYLYQYAAQNWGHHAFKVSDDLNISELLVDFLKNDAKVDGSCQALLVDTRQLVRPWSGYCQEFPHQITGLHLTAYFGLEKAMRILFQKGFIADSTDRQGRTPLSWAARHGHEDVAKLLLESGANRESKDEDGRTPLSWAAKNGHEDVMKLLVKSGANLEAKDDYGNTPLSSAIANRHEDAVKLLFAEEGVNVNSKNRAGETPLSSAARDGHEAMVELILTKEGVNANSKDSKGRTPLLHAASEGHEAIAKLLLARVEVNPNSKDKRGRTPLSWAAERNKYFVVQLLLFDKRVDADSIDKDSRTPLSWAAEKGFWGSVALLLTREEVNTNSKDKRGRTPLLYAATKGHEGVVKKLLERGAEVDSEDKSSRTPLSLAAMHGHERVVKILLERGANPDLKDDSGRTPLVWAMEYRYEAVVELLKPNT